MLETNEKGKKAKPPRSLWKILFLITFFLYVLLFFIELHRPFASSDMVGLDKALSFLLLAFCLLVLASMLIGGVSILIYSKKHDAKKPQKFIDGCVMPIIIGLGLIALISLKASIDDNPKPSPDINHYVFERGEEQIEIVSFEEEPRYGRRTGKLEGIWLTATIAVNKQGKYKVNPMQIGGNPYLKTTESDLESILASTEERTLEVGKNYEFKYFAQNKMTEMFREKLKSEEEHGVKRRLYVHWRIESYPRFPLYIFWGAIRTAEIDLQEYPLEVL